MCCGFSFHVWSKCFHHSSTLYFDSLLLLFKYRLCTPFPQSDVRSFCLHPSECVCESLTSTSRTTIAVHLSIASFLFLRYCDFALALHTHDSFGRACALLCNSQYVCALGGSSCFFQEFGECTYCLTWNPRGGSTTCVGCEKPLLLELPKIGILAKLAKAPATASAKQHPKPKKPIIAMEPPRPRAPPQPPTQPSYPPEWTGETGTQKR